MISVHIHVSALQAEAEHITIAIPDLHHTLPLVRRTFKSDVTGLALEVAVE
jgi:hypothetical protein